MDSKMILIEFPLIKFEICVRLAYIMQCSGHCIITIINTGVGNGTTAAASAFNLLSRSKLSLIVDFTFRWLFWWVPYNLSFTKCSYEFGTGCLVIIIYYFISL